MSVENAMIVLSSSPLSLIRHFSLTIIRFCKIKLIAVKITKNIWLTLSLLGYFCQYRLWGGGLRKRNMIHVNVPSSTFSGQLILKIKPLLNVIFPTLWNWKSEKVWALEFKPFFGENKTGEGAYNPPPNHDRVKKCFPEKINYFSKPLIYSSNHRTTET